MIEQGAYKSIFINKSIFKKYKAEIIINQRHFFRPANITVKPLGNNF